MSEDTTSTGRSPLAGSLKTILWSPWHVGFAFVLAVLGGLTLWAETQPIWPLIVIILADSYLILVLWCAAYQSSTGTETWPGLPYRQPAVVILAFVLSALVFAFGALYLNRVDEINSRSAAAYFSFVNLVTFASDHSKLQSGKWIVALQLASGVLWLIGAFPLVVSRLADFGGGVKNITFNGCTILLPDSSDATVAITGDKFEWTLAKKKNRAKEKKVIAEGPSGQVKITGVDIIEDAKLVVIKSDGECHVEH